MNLTNTIDLCKHLDAELARRERKGDLSLLASGAAFEQWLSFETRLLLEKQRSALGVRDAWWSANEHKKVDLGVWSGSSTLHVAMEFKLVHNNKNWRAKVKARGETCSPRLGRQSTS